MQYIIQSYLIYEEPRKWNTVLREKEKSTNSNSKINRGETNKQVAIIIRDVMEMLANIMVVSILQYINVSNQHTAHLKTTQCYVNYISKCIM